MKFIAAFKTLGKGGTRKVFKRNNRHGHTHAFGVLFKRKSDGREFGVASWGASPYYAAAALERRIGKWRINDRIEVLSEECVAVEQWMAG